MALNFPWNNKSIPVGFGSAGMLFSPVFPVSISKKLHNISYLQLFGILSKALW
jgi:hypothetical protein